MAEKIEVQIQVLTQKDGKYYVVFAPALDISSFAKTKKEANLRFSNTIELFFEIHFQKGTLEKVLKKLGWKNTSTVKISPPAIERTSVPFYMLERALNGNGQITKQSANVPVLV